MGDEWVHECSWLPTSLGDNLGATCVVIAVSATGSRVARVAVRYRVPS